MDGAERHQFEELYAALYPRVHGYVWRRTSPQDAQDITAEVFAVAWRRRTDIPADALPWLLGVARNVLAHHWRSVGRRDALNERVAVETAASVTVEPDHAEGHAEAELFRAALDRLSEPDREALRLWAWEGLDGKQAAAVLGCTRTAFNVRLHRARKRLTVALAELGAARPEPAMELGGAR